MTQSVKHAEYILNTFPISLSLNLAALPHPETTRQLFAVEGFSAQYPQGKERFPPAIFRAGTVCTPNLGSERVGAPVYTRMSSPTPQGVLLCFHGKRGMEVGGGRRHFVGPPFPGPLSEQHCHLVAGDGTTSG